MLVVGQGRICEYFLLRCNYFIRNKDEFEWFVLKKHKLRDKIYKLKNLGKIDDYILLINAK